MKQASNSSFAMANWLSRRGSLRTQLIAWNIAILALLLGGLGLVIRGAVYAAMLASIDHDLEERLRHFHEPPPPPGPPRRNPPVNTDLNSSVVPPASNSQPPPRPEDDRPQSAGNNAPDPMQEPDGNDQPRPQPRNDKSLPRDDPRGQAPPGSSFAGRNQAQPPQNSDPYRPLPFDLQGQVLGRAETRRIWDREAFAQALKGKPVYSTVVVGSEPLRVLSRRFPAQGAIAGVIQTAYPLGEVDRAKRGLDRVLLMLIPFALVCAGLAGSYLTGRVLRRVRSLTLAAEQMGAQALSQRLPVAGNDEFAGLAYTFNGLLGRLESVFKQQEQLLEQQRRFTADASHELKTPLTIIKGHTSLTLSGAVGDTDVATYRQSLREIDRAADSMSHLVQDLLLLARSDGGQLGRNPIQLLLREILERAISAASVHSGAKAILTVEDEGFCVSGNEMELVRLFANLVENAVRYTPETGSVSVTACLQNEQVLITITDTGIGIAPEHLPHLGERFYRVDTSRTRPTGGTGLGLSICKGIAQAHGGTLSFTSVVGKGTTVTVRLPS